MNGAGAPILQVRGLTKSYRRPRGAPDGVAPHKALDDLSLDLIEGEALGLVGESGCGKTTLARCLLRLEKPDTGKIEFLGNDWLAVRGRELRRQRRHMQAVFQDPYTSLNPRMTVSQIVAEPLAIHRMGKLSERRRRVAELLEAVGLERESADRLPREFSGGQRQRIAIARALACRPRLLIADEPVSALDVSIQGQIIALLADLRRRLGISLLFISHGLAVVRMLCDRVAVMYRGRLVELAPAQKLFSQARHPYTRLLLEAAPEPDPSRRDLQIGLELPESVRGRPGDLEQCAPAHWVAASPSRG